MRYIITFFWSFLLINMLVYVVCPMIGATYHFKSALLTSIPVALFTVMMSTIIEYNKTEKNNF